jgi:hypothetical protein
VSGLLRDAALSTQRRNASSHDLSAVASNDVEPPVGEAVGEQAASTTQLSSGSRHLIRWTQLVATKAKTKSSRRQ